MKVKVSELKDLAHRAILFYGYSEQEARIILECLLYAQLRDNNQGIVKLIGNGIPKNQSAGEILFEKETQLSAVLNGNRNMGMVVLKRATEIALTKAQEHGFGIVGTNNTSSSTGALGYYAFEIAERGFTGYVFAGSPPTVSTYGSYEPIFGTNPIAIGIPTDGGPLVLDMATAAIAYFGLIEASVAGRSIPNDVAYDAFGEPTTDPAKALEGAIRPFDRGYKGAGLAMMVEILTGPLVGAAYAGLGNTAGNWGNLVFVIDPGLLAGREMFKTDVSRLVNQVKETKKYPSVSEILAPGERGSRLAQTRIASGEIEIDDSLYQELRNVLDAGDA